MTTEVQADLFEPFFTTQSTSKGTGLGLATIYGIAKHNGGALLVRSEADRGAVFKVYLPQTDERIAAPAASAIAERPAIAAAATVLIVEDDEGIRELASKVLSRHGFVVLVASCGDEARGVSERHDAAIDLLLSDVVMPGMSGPQVAAMLTEMRPSMKVVYMSGYTDDAIVRHGVMANDMAFLQKPFTPDRLTNKILEVLNN